ncbi:rhamnogalacturonan lyase, partial [candidate division KSB1 bacterium]|nr:rhamnogalacturonan lyase [candidate division KSB1 bacterium]
MKHIQQIISIISILLVFAWPTTGQDYKLENLDRGLVAVTTPDAGIYIGWRLLATDSENVKFNIYRGSTKINDEPLATSTNFIDPDGTVNDTYSVAPVIDGLEQQASETVAPWRQNYKTIPLQRPQGGRTPDGVNYTYSPNDA